MKINAFLLLGAVLLGWLVAPAQENRKISFDQTTHQFGTLKKGDPAEHTFVFTNQSEDPIKLQRVRASCGCTTPSWTKAEVAPGANGEIKVKYNSNRVGPFTKTITVTYDSVERPIVLYIKGKVDGTSQAELARFKERQGNLGFEKSSQNLGVLDSDKSKTVSFAIRNNGPKPIRFTGQNQVEMMYDVSVEPSEIIPGGKATVKISVQGERFIQPGAFSSKLALMTDDPVQPEKTLTVSGTINKVFSAEELAQMPNIEFEAKEYDGGNVLAGEKVQYAFKFRNTGQEDLVIEQVKASCGCTATAPKDKIVPAGATSEIMATFDSRGRKGMQNKTITVRSNDPDQGTVLLRLKINVEEDPFHQSGVGPAAGSGRQ